MSIIQYSETLSYQQVQAFRTDVRKLFLYDIY